MPVKCQHCGSVFPGTVTHGPCPVCGFTGIRMIIDTSENYSGTVAISGSNVSAVESINYTKNMLNSFFINDPKRAPFLKPIISQLDNALEAVREQEKQLAIAMKPDWIKYEKTFEEYSDLLEKNAEEPEFQTFFEKVPVFLESKAIKAYSKYSLAGELIPDFLLELSDSSYLIVEIEKPGFKLFTQAGIPTAHLTQATQQIRDFLKFFAENIDFLRKRECSNLTGDNFKGLLVIGKSSDLNPSEIGKLQNINAEVRNRFVIKTFDQLLKENEALFEMAKKYY